MPASRCAADRVATAKADSAGLTAGAEDSAVAVAQVEAADLAVADSSNS